MAEDPQVSGPWETWGPVQAPEKTLVGSGAQSILEELRGGERTDLAYGGAEKVDWNSLVRRTLWAG